MLGTRYSRSDQVDSNAIVHVIESCATRNLAYIEGVLQVPQGSGEA